MVKEGIKGFSGLIDLPGTVASAVVGNAGAYNCQMKDICVGVDFLDENGERYIDANELRLGRRTSIIKRKELCGVILRVYLKAERGDKEIIQKEAELAHETRKKTQPDPNRNLGSIYLSGQPSRFSLSFVSFHE